MAYKIFIFILVFLFGFFLSYFFNFPENYYKSPKSKDAPSKLSLSSPFLIDSSWQEFKIENGAFLPTSSKDTWFVYGWFGAIASIKNVGGIQYEFFGNKHSGIDFSAREGLPVVASANGEISFVGEFYGKTLMIRHQDGYETVYGHLSQIFVKEGQKVKRGDLIGKVGNTGTTNPHLHFELRRMVDEKIFLINPRKLLKIDWEKVVIPDFQANHFYEKDPNDPDLQEDFPFK